MMKNLKKIKLKELVNDSFSKVEELSEIKGGIGISLFAHGCYSGVCSVNIDGGTKFCTGGDAVCQNGID